VWIGECVGRGFTLLRFELKAPLRMALVPTMGAPGYRFLWVAWVDQFADSVCLHDAQRTLDLDGPATVLARAADARVSFALHDAQSQGYELVSLVPDATEYIRVGETDANGYRQTSPREWKWSGWDAAILDHGETAYGRGDASLLWFAMQKCGTRVAQAPIAILTDADTASIP